MSANGDGPLVRRPTLLSRGGAALATMALLLAVGGSALLRPASWHAAEERMKTAPGTAKRAMMAALGMVGPAGLGAAQPLPPPRPTTIGINLADIHYYSSTVPFANLAIGNEWIDSHWQRLPDERVDADGNLKSVPVDGVAQRFLMFPPTGPQGFDVRCTYTGAGMLAVNGIGPPIKSAPHSLSFHMVNEHGKQPPPWLVVSGFNPANPLRDLDCRDARLDRTARFRPEYLQFLHGFKVVRFMDWQNANANEAVPWAKRHTPASLATDRDGVAIEDMLALARELDADPWFVVPWNADADYVSRFATMVRAQLPAGRSVYVEVGNEVWNNGFPAARQAIKEGLERKLSTDGAEAGLRRYAQRTVEVMRLWEAAFAGRGGLVRVLSTQHVLPSTAKTALSFEDTAAHVDALATAPYFGGTLPGVDNTRESSLQFLRAELPKALEQAVANRQVATSFGKRYIGYEGGAGLALPVQKDLLTRIQHDEAMYELYQHYLAGWARDNGDVLCLFNSVSRPSSWGMWGLAEWEDETPSQAPKLRATRDFMARK